VLEPLDIFKIQKDGAYLWKGAATNLELAITKVERLAANAPGEYVIFSQITGDKTVIPLDAA
jgi:hypothetical protein